MRLVLEGKLSEEHVTLEEVLEVQQRVDELIMERTIERLVQTNPCVFSGMDKDTIN